MTDVAMSDRGRRWLWLGVGLIMAALLALNVFTWWIDLTVDPARAVSAEPGFTEMFRYFGPEFSGDSIGFGLTVLIGAVVLTRDRTNRFAWVFTFFSVPWMAGVAFIALSLLSFSGYLPEAWGPWFALGGTFFFALFSIGTLLILALFPTGRFPDGWIRPALKTGFAVLSLIALLTVFAPGGMPTGTGGVWAIENPLGSDALAWFGVGWSDAAHAIVALLAIISLVIRYRASNSEVRLQIKWVATAMVLMTVTAAGMIVLDTAWEGYLVMVALWLTVGAVGVAITKHRLYEIDIVISRSLVFLLLAGFITLVYTSIVVGVGSTLGGSSVGWSVAATALVALVFEPVRDRVHKWVNRLVYGRRATPYEVLSDLTGRLAATESEEGLLDRMATRLAQGTGAHRAVVWIHENGVFRAAACEPGTELPLESVESIGGLPGTTKPIEHEGDLLGAISLEHRRGESLTPTEVRLVDDLAGSAGLLMRRLRLERDLEKKAHELEVSRRRLVDAQDVERRRLERELNDGAQQQVVALKLQLGIAESQAKKEGAETAAALIAQMTSETQDALDQITALANGIYPPLLESDGLAVAVSALGERAPVEVRVEADVRRRYPLAIEAALYFSISEAITNAVKHAAGPLRIHLSDATGDIEFTVTDSGPGFDPSSVERGSGLNNRGDRLEALGGDITSSSIPGAGTTVGGRVPVALPVA